MLRLNNSQNKTSKFQLNIKYIMIIILIFFIIYVYYICMKDCKNKDYYHNQNNNKIMQPVYMYVISWKKVANNALKIYNEVSKVFPNVYFIDCDETTEKTFPNQIKLTDKEYYGAQFETAINHIPSNAILGIVVGDIKTNYTDWNMVYQNLTKAFMTYDIGVYAPFEERTGWMQSKGTLSNKNLHKTDNTDCTVWFLHPDVVKAAKTLDIAKNSPYGWGIDIVLCKYAMHIGKYVVYDTSVKVSNPTGTGYDSGKAVNQMNVLNNIAVKKKLFK